jgi:hypothetical protein
LVSLQGLSSQSRPFSWKHLAITAKKRLGVNVINVFDHRVREFNLSGTFVARSSVIGCTLSNDMILPKGSKIMYCENYNDVSDGNGYSVVDVSGSYVEEFSEFFTILTPKDIIYFIAKRRY